MGRKYEDEEYDDDDYTPKAFRDENNSKRNRKRKQKRSKLKTAFRIFLILLMISVIAAGIFAAAFINDKLNKVNYVDIDENEIEVNEEVEEIKGYRNIALFGVDARSNTFKGCRSDCVIIVSINESTKDVKLISVYRDSYVNMKGYGYDKLTHAYAYGGPELAISTLNKNLDLKITEFVTVNFYTVIKLVDEIGGVDIEVDSAELRYINDYIFAINSEEHTKASKVTKTGVQTLNGVQALAYSRIRYTEGGDYKRTERMREVLTASFDKIKKLGLTKLNSLIDEMLPNVYTNIKSGEILSLASQALQYNVGESIGWPYEVSGATIGGVWYGVPKNMAECVTKLHKEVWEEEDYTPSKTLQNISDEIIKKTGVK